jgi:RNase P subunit RPR2
MPLKEAIARRREVLIIACPHCGHIQYLNIEDDPGEGFLPDSGHRMECEKCRRLMLVLPE